MKKHVIYVYGTLRTGSKSATMVEIPGAMYDLGWYPGIKLCEGCNTVVKCERIVVDDEKLAELDAYEGYRPENPDYSLYLRVPVLDGEIYVYNHDVNPDSLIPDGDWLRFHQKEKGSASSMVVAA